MSAWTEYSKKKKDAHNQIECLKNSNQKPKKKSRIFFSNFLFNEIKNKEKV